MTKAERVVENLNRALHSLFARDATVLLIGEDILDPYGGAFKVSKGLSTAYPDRVLTTPLSEEAIIGLASGLALCGEKALVEIMFGDFIALGFDQILNFATKSVSMYGQRLAMHLVIRCPVGGNRAYGPTHSQSLQKHFISIPHLDLFEISPFHDNEKLLDHLINLGTPCILFENKSLYTQYMYRDGFIDDLFRFEFLDAQQQIVRTFINGYDEHTCLVITSGGMVSRVLAAARSLLIDFEIGTQMIVPAQLYPFSIEPFQKFLTGVDHIFIVEESVAGGTWGCEVSQCIYERL